MLEQLLPACDCLILTAYQLNPRALPVRELYEMALEVARKMGTRDVGGPVARLETAASPADAWQLAQQLGKESDVILATGSFFLAAELLPIIA